jgi:hypothetical protein
MLALYDEFDTYWQNGGYKKISDIIFAEWHIFIVSNLCPGPAVFLGLANAKCEKTREEKGKTSGEFVSDSWFG